MAIETVDFYIRPEDGWVLVATNPATLVIRPDSFWTWHVAATSGGLPADTVVGLLMGRERQSSLESFETSGLTGEVYIRIAEPPSAEDTAKLHFGVIRG